MWNPWECVHSACAPSQVIQHTEKRNNETAGHLYLVLKRSNAKWFTLCPHSVPSYSAHSPVQCWVWLFWAQQAENSIRDPVPQPQDLELFQKVLFGHVSLGTIAQTALCTNLQCWPSATPSVLCLSWRATQEQATASLLPGVPKYMAWYFHWILGQGSLSTKGQSTAQGTNSGPHTSAKSRSPRPWVTKPETIIFHSQNTFPSLPGISSILQILWHWPYLLACANSMAPASWSIKMVKNPSDSHSWNGCRSLGLLSSRLSLIKDHPANHKCAHKRSLHLKGFDCSSL